MPFCTCGDIELYYENHGAGDPLLFISGLGGGTWSWFNQVPFFQEHYRTITFDNRGAGRSGIPAGPYSMRTFARDALCLLDRLEVERAFVVGLSMGGMIALELSLLAPERVSALVLGCTHCGGGRRVPPSPETVRVLVANDGLTQEQIIHKNLPLFFSEQCLNTKPERSAAYCRVQLSAPPQPQEAFLAQLAAITAFDCSERLSELRVPALILTGTRDILVPGANARFLARHIPGAQIVEIAGAGHAMHFECPETLNGLILDFLRKNNPRSASSEMPKL